MDSSVMSGMDTHQLRRDLRIELNGVFGKMFSTAGDTGILNVFVTRIIGSWEDRNVTIENLEKELRIKTHTITDRFKKKYGCTPAQFLQMCRTVAALVFMAKGFSFEESAMMSGFGHLRRMRDSFKRIFHSSPRRVRRCMEDGLPSFTRSIELLFSHSGSIPRLLAREIFGMVEGDDGRTVPMIKKIVQGEGRRDETRGGYRDPHII